MSEECLFCQRPIYYQLDWRNLIGDLSEKKYCLRCLNDKALLQNSLNDYIFQNHYHLRYYLSEVLAQFIDYKGKTIYTIGYPRETANLYDEMYAVVSLLTSKCYSLTPTKLNQEKRDRTINNNAICLAFERSKETKEYSQSMKVIIITELLNCSIQK